MTRGKHLSRRTETSLSQLTCCGLLSLVLFQALNACWSGSYYYRLASLYFSKKAPSTNTSYRTQSIMSPLSIPHTRSRAAFKTPEPLLQPEVVEQPEPPRRRFRLRRLVSSSKDNAPPTQQFLASVNAADVPVPSIEEPQVVDEDMAHLTGHANAESDAMDLSNGELSVRAFSPPKTPAPMTGLAIDAVQYREWSMESRLHSLGSSPEYDSSRPSTSHSTSGSLFSQFSFATDDFNELPSPTHGHTGLLDSALSIEDGTKTIRASASQAPKTKKAPWTDAMAQHLWSTWQKYKDDPTRTPMHMGKSPIPPPGVVNRVAREARRTWAGSKSQQKAANRSGSATPTAEAHGAFISWPHTDGATRAYFRKLCKVRAGFKGPASRALGASPTPYGRSAKRVWSRRAAPLRSPSVFSSSDMALSLAVSTSDSMQPSGPLAQLTQSQRELPQLPELPVPVTPARSENASEPAKSLLDAANLRPATPEPQMARLGSPFVAQSYGPSSSNALADALGLEPDSQRRCKTLGHRRSAKSPTRVTRSRSNTQKRRSRPSVLESRKHRKQSFASDIMAASPVAPLSEFSSIASSTGGDLMVPRSNIQEMFGASHPAMSSKEDSATPVLGLSPPARLGSPFAGARASTSRSVPNRRSGPASVDFGALRRPFFSVNENLDNSSRPTRASLATKLAHLDERLNFFRRRSGERGRSRSPQ